MRAVFLVDGQEAIHELHVRRPFDDQRHLDRNPGRIPLRVRHQRDEVAVADRRERHERRPPRAVTEKPHRILSHELLQVGRELRRLRVLPFLDIVEEQHVRTDAALIESADRAAHAAAEDDRAARAADEVPFAVADRREGHMVALHLDARLHAAIGLAFAELPLSVKRDERRGHLREVSRVGGREDELHHVPEIHLRELSGRGYQNDIAAVSERDRPHRQKLDERGLPLAARHLDDDEAAVDDRRLQRLQEPFDHERRRHVVLQKRRAVPMHELHEVVSARLAPLRIVWSGDHAEIVRARHELPLPLRAGHRAAAFAPRFPHLVEIRRARRAKFAVAPEVRVLLLGEERRRRAFGARKFYGFRFRHQAPAETPRRR